MDKLNVSKNKEIQLNSDDVTLLGFKLECNDNYLDLEAIEKYRYVQIDFTLTKSKKTLGADDNDPVVVKFSRLVMMRNPF